MIEEGINDLPPVLIGYGDHEGYRLNEVPPEMLQQLAARYPLAVGENDSPEYDELVITVAIHAELERRRAGGKPAYHVPSRRELAQLIVKRGFQRASKQHHPDGTGHHDAQVRLSQVRDELLEHCSNVSHDMPDNAVIVPAPTEMPTARARAATANEWDINDDDIPF